jgi:hypothetical protein
LISTEYNINSCWPLLLDINRIQHQLLLTFATWYQQNTTSTLIWPLLLNINRMHQLLLTFATWYQQNTTSTFVDLYYLISTEYNIDSYTDLCYLISPEYINSCWPLYLISTEYNINSCWLLLLNIQHRLLYWPLLLNINRIHQLLLTFATWYQQNTTSTLVDLCYLISTEYNIDSYTDLCYLISTEYNVDSYIDLCYLISTEYNINSCWPLLLNINRIQHQLLLTFAT